ncbi:hypothetical protein NDU88_001117 [Pleurodeles waltl]|uniref:Aquaporin-10 n=1 Tax=Pleurodeles waltl TaxID=8319 RepID=A0AAV7KSL4_PLEWA|nr:hypothetical protein NDU88_001117 [Pleurodeles waltl]
MEQGSAIRQAVAQHAEHTPERDRPRSGTLRRSGVGRRRQPQDSATVRWEDCVCTRKRLADVTKPRKTPPTLGATSESQHARKPFFMCREKYFISSLINIFINLGGGCSRSSRRFKMLLRLSQAWISSPSIWWCGTLSPRLEPQQIFLREETKKMKDGLQLMTNGSTAQAVTSFHTKGGYFTMYLGGALAVTVAIYVSGGVSGGHLNPAFSLSMCLLGRFQWRKLPLFVVIQIVASFAAAGTAYALYYGSHFPSVSVASNSEHSGALSNSATFCAADAIQHYCNGNLTVTGPTETASIFATYPAGYLTIWNGFLDQVIGTAMLLVGILAIVDSKNKPVPKGLEPLVVGLLVLSIGLSMGSNCGYPINPARDLGPRLFTFLAGWGPEVFSAGNHYWWIPVIAPLFGAVIGSVVYEVFVEFHHPDNLNEQLACSDNKDMEKGMPESKIKKLEVTPTFTIDTYMKGCTECP